MKNIVVLYHGDEDGFAGAWVAWKKFKEKAQYREAIYNSPPPKDLRGKEIYFIDFCYNEKAYMEKVLRENKRVVVIDHHASQKETMKIATETIFNNSHSASVLAWKYFFPGRKTPNLLTHIEDMDLWKFKKKNTREIIASLDTYPFDFRIWDKIVSDFERPAVMEKYLKEGRAIVKYQDKLIADLAEGGTEVIIGGRRAVSVNSPILQSEIGNYIWKKKGKIGLIWNSKNGRVKVGLRSRAGVDVSKIAKKFGGGGHKQASGFSFEKEFNFPWKKIK